MLLFIHTHCIVQSQPSQLSSITKHENTHVTICQTTFQSMVILFLLFIGHTDMSPFDKSNTWIYRRSVTTEQALKKSAPMIATIGVLYSWNLKYRVWICSHTYSPGTNGITFSVRHDNTTNNQETWEYTRDSHCCRNEQTNKRTCQLLINEARSIPKTGQ